jgi:hypothetical protein
MSSSFSDPAAAAAAFTFDNTKSTGDNVVYATTTYLDSLTDTCRASSANFQTMNINCRGPIDYSNVNMEQVQIVNTKCTESVLDSSAAADALGAYNAALASKLAQNATANPKGASKDQIFKQTISISTAVVNSVKNTCLARAMQSQKLDIQDCNNASVHAIDWQQYSSNALECVFANQNVVNASVALSNLTGNHGSSTKSKALPLWMIILIVAGSVVVVGVAVGVPLAAYNKRRRLATATAAKAAADAAAAAEAAAVAARNDARLGLVIKGAIEAAGAKLPVGAK